MKLGKGRCRSLTVGQAAIATLPAFQSQGVVTCQGQRFSGVPPEQVNDEPLPPTWAWIRGGLVEGRELIRCRFFISWRGER